MWAFGLLKQLASSAHLSEVIVGVPKLRRHYEPAHSAFFHAEDALLKGWDHLDVSIGMAICSMDVAEWEQCWGFIEVCMTASAS